MAAPILPDPPLQYERDYMQKLLSTFRLFFTGQLDGALEQLQTMNKLQVFANNAAAVAGGLQVGQFYRTGGNPDAVCAVH